MTNKVYQNEHYVIMINGTFTGYDLVNKVTKVKEGSSEVFSSAIGKADAWSEVLSEIAEKKGWK